MYITQLPSEIINKILKELSGDSLRQCLFVCKLLSVEAARICYQQVVLSNNHKSFVEATTRRKGRSIGDYVRVLEFNFETRESERLSEEDFAQLLSNLPQLSTIQLDITSNIEKYLKYLLSMPLRSSATIQNISIPNSSILKRSILSNYLLVTERLRSTITTLCLDSFCVPYFNDKCDNVLRFLSGFVNLKSLSISNITRCGLQGINMISVLPVCSQLTHFDLYSEFADMDEFTSMIPYDNTQKKNTTLEVLKLIVQDLTESNIDYLVKKEFTSLKMFHLQIGNKGLGHWLKTTSGNRVCQFIDFLKRIPSVRIHMADDIRVDQPFDLLPTWHFVHQLYHDRLIYKLKILLSETTRCFHIIDLKQTQRLLELYLCIPLSSLNSKYGIDTSFVNAISITNFSETTSFDIEPILNRININRQHLWSIKLHDGKKSLSISPYNKKRTIQLYKSMKILGKQDSLPKDKMEIITLNRYDIDNNILTTFAYAYPETKDIIFSKCNYVHCEIVGKNNHQYNIDLRKFDNLEEVQFNMDTVYLRTLYPTLSRFFIQVDCSFGKRFFYCCTLDAENDPSIMYYLDQCKPSLLNYAEGTFIMAIQSSKIEAITLKAKLHTNETYVYQIVLPYYVP